MPDTSAPKPTNIIYTGVAGTGKTHRLLQLAEHYTDHLPRASDTDLLTQLLQALSWREVVCLVFLDLRSKHQDLVKVPEIVQHEFFVAKAAQNAREKNLSNTAWSVLQIHTPHYSTTVNYHNKASQAYFDKDDSGAWYLLPECLTLLEGLSQQLAEFWQAKHDNHVNQDNAVSQPRFSMVSFHQAYGYEEFVEGIRPVMVSSGQASHSDHAPDQMRYAIQEGAFLALCQRAANDPKRRYAMLIDEINRANISRVFGELLSVIEPDKRMGMAHAMTVALAYSGRVFGVPNNVDIYATMNTQDHSLAPLDMALRRRFRFINCPPQPELLPTIDVSMTIDLSMKIDLSVESHIPNERSDIAPNTIDLAKLLAGLNRRIVQTLGADFQLGHAFLFTVTSLAQLQDALIEAIIPQLVQAAGGQVAVLQYLFNDDLQPINAQFIQDMLALMASEPNAQTDHTHPSAGHNQRPSGPTSFFDQPINTGGHQINSDLIAKTGAFTKPATYQRLY